MLYRRCHGPWRAIHRRAPAAPPSQPPPAEDVRLLDLSDDTVDSTNTTSTSMSTQPRSSPGEVESDSELDSSNQHEGGDAADAVGGDSLVQNGTPCRPPSEVAGAAKCLLPLLSPPTVVSTATTGSTAAVSVQVCANLFINPQEYYVVKVSGWSETKAKCNWPIQEYKNNYIILGINYSIYI